MDETRKTPEQVAKAAMDKINAKKVADKENNGKKEEARDASSASSTEIKTKGQEQSNVEKAEAKAKRDEQLLTVSDDDIKSDKFTDDDRTRRTELIDTANKTKKEKEDTEKKDGVTKRIGELTGELKDMKRERAGDKEAISNLEKEIESLKKQQAPIEKASDEQVLTKQSSDRINKYLEEDKAKPLEQRREMSREDLEEWLDEDNVAATEWMTNRTLRRSEEAKDDKANLKSQKFLRGVLDKQDTSAKKALVKHPELDTDTREKELKAEGKKQEEIFEILCKENPKFRTVQEIIKENPEKYLLDEKGPELAVAEMEKRLGKDIKPKDKDKGKVLTEEDIEAIKKQAIADEDERRANADDNSASNSTRNKDKTKPVELTELQQAEAKILNKVGMSKETLDKNKARRSKIPGAASYNYEG